MTRPPGPCTVASIAVAILAALAIAAPSALAADCGGLTPTIVDPDGDGDGVIIGNDDPNVVDVIDGLGGDDEIYGFDGDDVICGREGADTLIGNDGDLANPQPDGDDDIYGGGGDDLIAGEIGDDTLDGGPGSEGGIFGGAGEDELLGGDGRDLLAGEADEDSLDGGPGDDAPGGGASAAIFGDAGDDQLVGGAGRDFLEGEAGEDSLDGGPGDDAPGGDVIAAISGDAGDDQLVGGAGHDFLLGGDDQDALGGGEGNDEMLGEHGSDGLDGGGGIDTASYINAPAGVDASLVRGDSTGGDGNDSITRVENLIGSDFPDLLIGNDDLNVLEGRLGDDVIVGGAGGNDIVDYAAAPDGVAVDLAAQMAHGAAGEDRLSGIEGVGGSPHGDFLSGDAGPNTFTPRGGNDTIFGVGDQANLLSYDGTPGPGGVIVDLAAGTARGASGNDTIREIQTVLGSQQDDVLLGDEFSNSFSPGPGDDLIDGRGGDGDALLSAAGEEGPLIASLVTGDATSLGGGHDRLANLEVLDGSPFADTLIGDDQFNLLNGLGGDDALYGKGDDDVLSGGDGHDELHGGAGTLNTASFTDAPGGVTIDLGAGTANVPADGGPEVDSMVGMENVFGSRYADTMIGDDGNNYFVGGPGNDRIEGRGALDFAAYYPIPIVTSDVTNATFSDTGPISYDATAGTVDDSGDGSQDALAGVEVISGSDANDVMIGDSGSDFFLGEGGNDVIEGRGGADFIDSGPGSDKTVGGKGRDYLTYLITGGGPIAANLGKRRIVDGPDLDKVRGFELLGGTDADDTMIGSRRREILLGENGSDALRGRGGRDTLDGREGQDRLDGGPSFDHCVDGRPKRCESKALPKAQLALIAAAEAFKEAGGGYKKGSVRLKGCRRRCN